MPVVVVSHLLDAARGGTSEEGRSWFTGRVAELRELNEWLLAGEPGVFLVTGPADTGTSAIVGRLVSLSNPVERNLLLANGSLAEPAADPGVNSIHAHVHARRLDVDGLAAHLDHQLVRAGFWPESPTGDRNGWELIGIAKKTLVSEKQRPRVPAARVTTDEAYRQSKSLRVCLEDTTSPIRGDDPTQR